MTTFEHLVTFINEINVIFMLILSFEHNIFLWIGIMLLESKNYIYNIVTTLKQSNIW